MEDVTKGTKNSLIRVPELGCEVSTESTATKAKPGPAKREDSTVPRKVNLTPEQWEYVEKYATPGHPEDYPPKNGGKWNPSPALRQLVNEAKALRPLGAKGGRKRDSAGRWAGEKPCTPQMRRDVLERQHAAYRAMLLDAGIDPDSIKG